MLLNIKKMAPIFTGAVFFIILDRFLKILAKNFFSNNEINIIGDILKFNFSRNYGIAFSIPFTGLILNIVIVFIIIILIYFLVFFIKQKNYLFFSLLLFIVFGAISNILDRISYGFVIDYIDLEYFTVFNIADIMIVCGALGLVYCYIINNHYEYGNNKGK